MKSNPANAVALTVSSFSSPSSQRAAKKLLWTGIAMITLTSAVLAQNGNAVSAAKGTGLSHAVLERLEALEARVADLETVNAELLGKLAYVSIETGPLNGLAGPHFIIEGCNVHVRNDAGSTATQDGLGNLVIGYNEDDGSDVRTGSHNLVIGADHTYTIDSGIVSGANNAITGILASVIGGFGNVVSGDYSMASGANNEVSGTASTASGYNNVVSSWASTASGRLNDVSGNYSTASGHSNIVSSWASAASGIDNVISGNASAASGGRNDVSGSYSTVSGRLNGVSGDFAAASGQSNVVSGDHSLASGSLNGVSGDCAVASGRTNVVSGWASAASGAENEVSGPVSTASGSKNVVSGAYSTVSGAVNDTNGVHGVTLMGRYGTASPDPFSWQLGGGVSETDRDISIGLRTTTFGVGEGLANGWTTGGY